MNKTTLILDASAIKESACMLRLFNTVVLGYKGKISYNDVEFGTAFHIFRKIYREKGMPGMAEGMLAASAYYKDRPMLIKHNKKYLDLTFLQKVCLEYATIYQQDNLTPVKDRDGEALLELTFAYPYYVDDEVEVLLAGTMDEIGKFHAGTYAIVDAKTTSVWDIDSYFRAYYLNAQLLFYRVALNYYASAHPESIFAEINKFDVACMIDGIFLKGATADPIFRRSEVFLFSAEQVAEFEVLLRRKIMELVGHVKMWRQDANYRPLREGMINTACETVYGPCKYHPACAAKDPQWREAVYENNFRVKSYNPLAHNE